MIKPAIKKLSKTTAVIAEYFGVKKMVTTIAKRLGILNKKGNPDPNEAKRCLVETGLQECRDKECILIDKGKGAGEAKPYTNSGHSGYVINWYDTVLEGSPAAGLEHLVWTLQRLILFTI